MVPACLLYTSEVVFEGRVWGQDCKYICVRFIQKQGDFFVESPIILLAAIIWYLRIYKDGKYCTFPHAIEFLNKPYADIFTILDVYKRQW